MRNGSMVAMVIFSCGFWLFFMLKYWFPVHLMELISTYLLKFFQFLILRILMKTVTQTFFFFAAETSKQVLTCRRYPKFLVCFFCIMFCTFFKQIYNAGNFRVQSFAWHDQNDQHETLSGRSIFRFIFQQIALQSLQRGGSKLLTEPVCNFSFAVPRLDGFILAALQVGCALVRFYRSLGSVQVLHQEGLWNVCVTQRLVVTPLEATGE